MDYQLLKNGFNLFDYFSRHKYFKDFAESHPNYFGPIGTLIFSGKQGSGKTLSMVNYLYNIIEYYPCCLIVTNVAIRDYPFNTRYEYKDGKCRLFSLNTGKELPETETLGFRHTEDSYICIEYDGLDCLKYITNSFHGVVYAIDEFHLELNSLESKNIDIDVITEISQQRKQRKHIIGTSQVYMRLAKPLREQIFNIVLCNCWFGWIQYNKLIDGETSEEKDGKLVADVKKRIFFTHKVDYYERYDTFAKMKRLNDEWQGHKRSDSFDFTKYM